MKSYNRVGADLKMTCIEKMVRSAADSALKLTLLRLNFFSAEDAFGFANQHMILLMDSRTRKSSGASIDPLGLQLSLMNRESSHPVDLEDELREFHADPDVEDIVPGVANEDFSRLLSCSIVQVQTLSGVLFLRAILERFAFDFGGAAIMLDRSGTHNPREVMFSDYERDLLLDRIFKGQPYTDRNIFDELIKLDRENLFQFPRPELRQLRDLRNKIAHEEQRIDFDFEHASFQVDQFRNHISEVRKAIDLVFQSQIIRKYFPQIRGLK